MQKYNAWGVAEVSPINGKMKLLKRDAFTRTKLGHDDEVDRERFFKSRQTAKLALKWAKKYTRKVHHLRVVKVMVPRALIAGTNAKKALG